MRFDSTTRLASLVFCVLLSAPTSVIGQNLTEAVQIALSQYPTIQAAQSRVDAADYDIVRARGAHYPQLGWQGTNSKYSDVGPNPFGPEDTWIQSPTMNLNIWSGWRIQSEVERAQSVHNAQRQQQRITRDEVAFLVVDAYLNWMRSSELVGLAQKNLAAHERLTRDVQKIAAIDQGRGIDVDQAQVRTENARLLLDQRLTEQQIYSQRLQRMLLGRLPQNPDGYQNIKGVLPKNTEQALAFLTDDHPVIAQELAQIQGAEAAVRSAKSGFSPQVDLSYQRQTAQGSGQGDYIAQLNVQVPLFDGGTAYGATRSAYAELDAAKQGLTEAKVTLRENLLASWAEYLSAKQRATLGQKQVVNAIKLVKGYDQQFRVGRRSLLDLLNIQDNLYSYQTNATNAAFEERIAKAKILAILNRLASTYQGDDSASRYATPPLPTKKDQNNLRGSDPSNPSDQAGRVNTQFGSSTNMRTGYGQ